MKTAIFLGVTLTFFGCRSENGNNAERELHAYEIQNITIKSEIFDKVITYSDDDRRSIPDKVVQTLQKVAESEEKIIKESIDGEILPSLAGSYIVGMEFKNTHDNFHFVSFLNLDEEGNIIIKRYSDSIEDKALKDFIKEIIQTK